MSWHPAMEFNYMNNYMNSHMNNYMNNNNFPYNSAGSFVNFFEGLAYEHVNFIFNDANAILAQESMYPTMHTNFYKFGLPEPGSVPYYGYSYAPVLSNHMTNITDYNSHLGNTTAMPNERHAEVHSQNPTALTNERHAEVHSQWENNSTINTDSNHVECPRGHHNAHEQQVVWQDNVDLDNMTYEELLDLGEAVGTQNRGLSQDLISMLPVRKFKCGFFSRKKSRDERCVVCQMEYKRGERQIILPCKHAYHVGCGTKWLSINKACPICYTEVFGDASKQ